MEEEDWMKWGFLGSKEVFCDWLVELLLRVVCCLLGDWCKNLFF